MKLFKREEGAALVEFALVISLLLLIVFGIIEFGRIFNAQITVTHAAREGARVGVVTPVVSRNAAIISAVNTRANPLTPTSIVIDPATATNEVETVTVTVSYNVVLLVPVISEIIDSDHDNKYTVVGQATMRLE